MIFGKSVLVFVLGTIGLVAVLFGGHLAIASFPNEAGYIQGAIAGFVLIALFMGIYGPMKRWQSIRNEVEASRDVRVPLADKVVYFIVTIRLVDNDRIGNAARLAIPLVDAELRASAQQPSNAELSERILETLAADIVAEVNGHFDDAGFSRPVIESIVLTIN
jgi:hypothetical protein